MSAQHQRDLPVHHDDAALQPTSGKRKRAGSQNETAGGGAEDVGHQAGLGAERRNRNPSQNGSAAGDAAVAIGEHQTAQGQGAERSNPNPSQNETAGGGAEDVGHQAGLGAERRNRNPSQNGSAAGDAAVAIGEHQTAQGQGAERSNPNPSQNETAGGGAEDVGGTPGWAGAGGRETQQKSITDRCCGPVAATPVPGGGVLLHESYWLVCGVTGGFELDSSPFLFIAAW
nr:golgin subfamily A member 6-like protein 2 isoform X1 [Pseudochaenichthys georgianus]